MKKSRGFFKLSKLFDSMFSVPGQRQSSRKPGRLALECLESRETPATYTWTPTAAGTFDWNNAANWGGAGFPNAADDVVNLNTDIAAGTQIINLNVPIKVGTINIGDSGTGAAGIINVAANGGSLTFDVTSGSATINKTTGSASDAINAPIQLNDPLVVNSTVNLQLSGVISESGGALGLTKSGSTAGTLILGGTNTFTGGVTVAAGGISIAAGANLGSGPLSFTGVGTLNVTGTAVTIPNNIALGSVNGRVTIVTPSNSNTVIGGIVSGGIATTEVFFQGGASGTNTGALTLTGANTFQGAINVQRGPLILANVTAAGTALIKLDSNLPVAGALQLAGSFTIANNVSLISGTEGIGVASGTAGISGVISGALPITKVGAGTLVLSGTNTFTGGIIVAVGGLTIADASNIGPGPLSFTGTTTLNITGAAVTIPNNISLGVVNGRVTLATPNSSSTVINGIVSGGIAATEWFFQGGAAGQNTGALTLNGVNTFQGAINVQRGPLILGNAAAAGTAVIRLDSNLPPAGALQLAGNFTIPNNVALISGNEPIGVGAGITAGIGGVISGTTQVTKVGDGTLALTGNNTYTNIMTIAAGTLQVGAGGTTGTLGPGAVTVNSTLAFKRSDTALVVANEITGTGMLVQSGTGATTLTNINNVYTGGTTIDAGTLILANVNGSATGTGPITINSTGALTGTGSASGAVTVNAGGTVAMTGTGNLAGAITVKTGGTLAGTATYAGSITAGGKVSPGGAAPGILGVADITFTDGAAKGTLVVDLNGTAPGAAYDQLTASGTINITGATLTASAGYIYFGNDKIVLINNTGSNSIVGAFAGMAEGSTVTLSGQAFTITYKGGDGNDLVLTKQPPPIRYVDDAWAALANGAQIADADPVASGNQAAVVGTSAFGTINAGIAAIPASGILIVNAGNYPEAVVINKAIGLVFQEGAVKVNSLADSVSGASISISTDSSASPITLTVGDATDTTVSSLISGVGSLTKVGAGVLTLAGSNFYSGATTISNGVLKMGSAAALSSATSAITIDAAATLRLNGVSAAPPSLAGAGKIENASATPVTVTFGGNGMDATFAGVIQDGTGGGALSVIKTGAGILTLSGTTNSYTGSTTVSGGILAIANVAAAAANSSIGAGAANVTLAEGTTLQIQGTGASMTTARGFNLGGAATIEVTSSSTTVTTSGLLAGGANAFNKTGNGKLIFTANNALASGPVSVVAGTLGFATQSFSRAQKLDIADGAIAESSGTLNLIVDASNTFNAITGTGTLRLVGAANNATTSPDIYFGPNHNSNDFWGVGIEPKVDVGAIQRFAFAKSGNNGFGQYAPDTDAMFRGDVVGTGGLTIIGQQINVNSDEVPYALYTADNSFKGPLTITRGSLYLNTGASLTGTPAVNFNPTTGNRARLFLWGNSITIGNLTSSGAGTPGIANGVRASGAAGTDNAPVTLTVTQSTDGAYGGVIADFLTERSKGGANPTGPFSLTKSGTAALTLSGGANSYTGVTTINQGVLSIGSIANGLANSDIGASDNTAANLVLGGGTLQYTGATAISDRGFTVGASASGIAVSSAGTTLTFTGGATGSGSLVKTGLGALVLNGVNDYTGPTTVTAGTFGGAGNAASAISISGLLNPGNLTAAGSFKSGNLTFGSGGILAINFNGPATGQPVAGTDFDQVDVTGSVNLTNATLNLLAGGVPIALTNSMTIIANDGSDPVIGTFAGQSQNSLVFVSGQLFSINYSGGDGNDVVLSRVAPTTIYADDNWSAFTNGQVIADADPVAAGNQPATFGTTAFASVGAAITAANTGSSVIVNAGAYSEAVNLNKQVSLTLQEGPISFNSLAGNQAGAAVTLQGITLTTGDATSTEFDGQILGTGNLTKTGTGSFLIAANNLFTGATTINNGTLAIGKSNALAASPVTINSGGKLQLNGVSLTLTSLSGTGTLVNSDLANSVAATLTLNAVTDITFGGSLQDGTGGAPLSLAKSGAGILTLSGANSTYSGATTVSGGVLSVGTLANGGSPSSIGRSTNVAANLVISGGATLLYSGNSTSIDRSLTIGVGGATISVTNPAATLTTSGAVAGGTRVLTKEGAGKLVFSTNDSLTTGNINVNNGTLGIANLSLSKDRLLTIAAGAFVESSGQLSTIADANLNPNTQVLGAGTLKLTSTTNDGTTSYDLYFNINDVSNTTANWGTGIAAKIDLGSAQRFFTGKTNHNGYGVYFASTDVYLSGPISGSGGITFVGQDPIRTDMEQPFALAAANTFTGPVVIKRGSVYLVDAKALNGNSVTFDVAAGGGNLFLYGHDFTIGNLSSTGTGGTARIVNGNRATGAVNELPPATLTINQTTPGAFSGLIVDAFLEYSTGGSATQGPVSIVKTGPAALTLSGASTYTGTTTVNAGAIIASNTTGSATGTGATTVASAATLGGTGAVGDVTVNSSGTVAPGTGPGKLTAANLALNSGAIFKAEINGVAPGVGYDQAHVTGATNLNANTGAGATLNVALGFVPSNGAQFIIIDNDAAPATGTFAGLAEGATFVSGGTTFKISYVGGTDNNDVVLTAQSSVAVSTTTTLVANPLATTGGSSVMFTATVAPSPGAAGGVTFLDNGVAIPGGSNIAIANGVAVFSTTALAVGNHTVTAAFNGAPGFNASTSNAQTVSISSGGTAPSVVSVTTNGGVVGFSGAQHSRIVNLQVVFDQAVQLDANAMTLALYTNNVNYGGTAQPSGMGTIPTTLTVTGSTDKKTWTMTFDGTGSVDTGPDLMASLKDGVYRLTIDATKVHPLSAPGINMGANSTTVFHRLYGDIGVATQTGNELSAIVNTGDNLQFRGAFNKVPGAGYIPYLDFNGDGTINTADNLQFRQRFNKNLTWAV